MKGQCTICGIEDDELKHYEFYVIGSEGVKLCFGCQIKTSKFLKLMKELASSVKINTISKIKKGE